MYSEKLASFNLRLFTIADTTTLDDSSPPLPVLSIRFKDRPSHEGQAFLPSCLIKDLFWGPLPETDFNFALFLDPAAPPDSRHSICSLIAQCFRSNSRVKGGYAGTDVPVDFVLFLLSCG
ncbi:hypothetical protein T265_07678 [Opisthorchis viverrini]|uniref:Uncharacterized protein n=1 Tax=Opisthorchis viverrini TaxID=6198 RepID=A0A075AAY2_OPIVI|nr:hypothetical protein T265_07678 [Opisthorchis viverrini]KER24724.1 hypothetical protein T265_07678 [Opisthorchis viverrini]